MRPLLLERLMLRLLRLLRLLLLHPGALQVNAGDAIPHPPGGEDQLLAGAAVTERSLQAGISFQLADQALQL